MADNIQESQFLPTGICGLDELLGGGILARRSLLVKGAPGTGKTTLGLQMLVNGAVEYDEPGILLTFEQYPDQFFEDVASFGWDLPSLMDDDMLQIQFVNPEEVLEAPGRQDNRIVANIADWVEQTGACRVLIDSISHLEPFVLGERSSRAAFLKLLFDLKRLGLTPIMTSELTPAAATNDLDAYLADSVIHLGRESGRVGQPGRRTIEIVKSRGQAHHSGVHPMEIGSRGVRVFPHTYPIFDTEAAETEESQMVTTGLTGLDGLLGGGYCQGSAVMVAGLSGTFKTTLAAHFLMEGVAEGAPGLWISVEETTSDLRQEMAAHGLDVAKALDDEKLHVLEINPGQESIEKTLTVVEAFIEARSIRNVVIDSMDELTFGLADEQDRHEAVHWFLKRLRRRGVTTMFTQHLSKVGGRNPLSEIKWADLSDTLIYLGLVEIESRLEKVVSVLKHRIGSASSDLRSIEGGPDGLRITDRFIGLSGVIEGAPFGKRKVQIEQIFQPLYFIRDFLSAVRNSEIEEEKRLKLIDNLDDQATHVIELLGKYFDHLPPSGQRHEPKAGKEKKK